ncbi:hypothetical protein ACO1PK_05520 [Alishewanella sp. d11]|uniref:hypothetical protein n=1 Tax=Alishewanella sp. d11 TaxID=3414030 RepID=UPI003BF79BFD
MTSPFVFNVHKNFAYRLKETGCNQAAITSHLKDVLLTEDEIQQILQALETADENKRHALTQAD